MDSQTRRGQASAGSADNPIPFTKEEMWRALPKTRRALVVTAHLFGLDGVLPTYGEVVVYGNGLAMLIHRDYLLQRGLRELPPELAITRKNAQDARRQFCRAMNPSASRKMSSPAQGKMSSPASRKPPAPCPD